MEFLCFVFDPFQLRLEGIFFSFESVVGCWFFIDVDFLVFIGYQDYCWFLHGFWILRLFIRMLYLGFSWTYLDRDIKMRKFRAFQGAIRRTALFLRRLSLFLRFPVKHTPLRNFASPLRPLRLNRCCTKSKIEHSRRLRTCLTAEDAKGTQSFAEGYDSSLLLLNLRLRHAISLHPARTIYCWLTCIFTGHVYIKKVTGTAFS